MEKKNQANITEVKGLNLQIQRAHNMMKINSVSS